MFSGKPASNGSGTLEDDLIAMETGLHIVFTPCHGVPGSSVFIYSRHLSLCFWGCCDKH